MSRNPEISSRLQYLRDRRESGIIDWRGREADKREPARQITTIYTSPAPNVHQLESFEGGMTYKVIVGNTTIISYNAVDRSVTMEFNTQGQLHNIAVCGEHLGFVRDTQYGTSFDPNDNEDPDIETLRTFVTQELGIQLADTSDFPALDAESTAMAIAHGQLEDKHALTFLQFKNAEALFDEEGQHKAFALEMLPVNWQRSMELR